MPDALKGSHWNSKVLPTSMSQQRLEPCSSHMIDRHLHHEDMSAVPTAQGLQIMCPRLGRILLLTCHACCRRRRSPAAQSTPSAKSWVNPSRSRPGTSPACPRTASASTMVSLWPTLAAGQCSFSVWSVSNSGGEMEIRHCLVCVKQSGLCQTVVVRWRSDTVWSVSNSLVCVKQWW